MTVLCCFTRPEDETLRRIAAYAPSAELINVSGDLEGYWRQIAARWGGSADLTIIEHDIGIHADVLPQFGACPEPWCVFPYLYPGYGLLARGLGCTRFRAAFTAAVPAAEITAIPGSCSMCAGQVPGCWLHLDGKIAQAAEPRGFAPHVHAPPVSHYRNGQEVTFV